MRDSTMWATTGGPIIGEIRNGKKYPFGTVSATQYEEDMAALNTEISGLNSAVVACQGSLTGLSTALDTLNGQYAATVPGLSQSVSDIRVQIGDVNAALTAAVARLDTSYNSLERAVENLDASYSLRMSTAEGNINELSATVIRNSTDIASQASAAQALSGRVDLLSSKLTHDTDALSARITTAEGDIQGLDLTLREHSSEISSQGETLNSLNRDVSEVSDLAAATSATTAANSEAITGIRDSIGVLRNSIANNTSAINAFNAAITELTSTQNVDRAVLTERIETIETRITALNSELASDIMTVNAQISELRTSITGNTQDIAVLQSALTTQGAEIEAQDARMTGIESRMNALEVAMATLRQQLLNSTMNMQDEIDRINTDKVVLRNDVMALYDEVSGLRTATEASLTQLNERVTALEGGGEPLEIVSFTATPNLCELGGHENIILSWDIRGTVKEILINGQAVTGSSVTIPDVTEATTFTLSVRDTAGNIQTRTVSISFANHIFYGTSASPNADEGTVKALEFTELSEQRTRTFSALAQYEYIYYAYPKRLGSSEFMVNDFKGGFEDPAVVSIDNHAGYEEDYYVYRSANKLNSTFEVHVL